MSTRKKTEPTPDETLLAAEVAKTDDVNEAPDPVTDEEIDAALTEKPVPVDEPLVETPAPVKPCLCSYSLPEIVTNLVGRTLSGGIAIADGDGMKQVAWENGKIVVGGLE